MFSEIITIGEEILIGQTVDSNSAFIAGLLNGAGIRVGQITSVSDREEQIIQSLEAALGRVRLVILTGGLGPTSDDITKKSLARFFNTSMVFHEDTFRHVKELMAMRGIPVNESARSQAEIPANALALHNRFGTAPGLWFDNHDRVVIALPGVPDEMAGLMEGEVIPRLRERFSTPPLLHRTVLTYGTYEARLAELLRDFESGLPEYLRLAYLPTYGVIKLRLSLSGTGRGDPAGEMEEYLQELRQVVGEWVFGYDRDSLQSVTGDLLRSANARLAVAESCTGGYISHLITSIPGSSDYFTGSVIAYANEIKHSQLGVEPVTLRKQGAVSREVVEQMARGILERFGTDYALATSGVAGPGGGSPEKPVGTIWIAAASREKTVSETHVFGRHRERNIIRGSYSALNLLRLLILSEK